MRTRFTYRPAVWLGVFLTVIALTASGCAQRTAAAPSTLQTVEVVPVEQRDVPVYREWIGTLDGMVNAAIKAQVSGYLLSQNYTEGSFVKQGQLLFQIDRRPFQAAADQAQGQLAQANAQLAQARAQLLQARRNWPAPRPISKRRSWMKTAMRRWPASRRLRSRIWTTPRRITSPPRLRLRRPRPRWKRRGPRFKPPRPRWRPPLPLFRRPR